MTQIVPDFDIDKWCIYNEKEFKLELREDAPIEIKRKFRKWKFAYDEPLIKELIKARKQ